MELNDYPHFNLSHCRRVLHRVLPDLSLFNITLTPTLRAEIIAAQKTDESMSHIKRRM
jgi:hypothetical protein